jgi:molecular chaperone IbpA
MAQRSFKLSLRLDEHIEVQQAIYDNGLLSIDLLRVVPEAEQPRKISIGQGSASAKLDVKKESAKDGGKKAA